MRLILTIALVACAGLQLSSQKIDRLILMVNADRNNTLLSAQAATLKADFTRFFNVPDIHTIYADRNPVKTRTGEDTTETIHGGLQKANQLCQDEGKTVAIAFVFEKDEGPTTTEIQNALQSVPSTLKIISNSYFSNTLVEISCGPHAILNYSIGEVRSIDTIETDEDHFPLIPIIGIAGLGTGILILTKGGDEGCTTVDPLWVSPNGICEGDAPLMLSVTGTPGGIWSGTGVTTSGVFDPSAGTQVITYTVGEGSCRQNRSQEIVVTHPDARWNSPGPVCSSESVSLFPAGTLGGHWSGDGVTDHGDGTATFLGTQAGFFMVTYTVGTGECESSLSHQIEVTIKPDANWSSPSEPICTGEEFMLTPTGSGGGTWSGEGVTDQGNGTGIFIQTNPGTYPVTYMVTQGFCSSSTTQDIEVIDQADPSWNAPGNVCTGDQVTLIPTGSPGGIWSGTGITDLGNGTGLFSATETGVYSITYTIGQGACQSSLTQDIQVFPVPDASWTSPANVCQEQQIILIPEGTPGGLWSGNGVTDLGDGTAQFIQPLPGIYEVTYTVNAGPCNASLSQSIEVVEMADPSWTPPSEVCTGQQVVLMPDSTSGGMWSGPGVTDQGDGTALFLQNNEGNYSVTYEVGTGSCAQSSTQDIGVIFPGDPSWNPPEHIICPGEIVELIAPEGEWSGQGVTNFGNGSGQFQSGKFGNYTITLTVGSGNCTAYESHEVEVGDNDPPVIEVPASDMAVPCDGSGNEFELQDWLDTHGGAEVSDLCSNNITWDHDFSGFPFDCGMSGTVFVSFTATDEYGNVATTSGEFTIEDNDPPVLEGVPQNIVVPCDAIPPPASVTADDVCSGSSPVEFEETPPGMNCPYEIVRIWTAMDDCGNATTGQQIITATDNVSPQPQDIPQDIIIHCPGPPETCIPPPDPPTFIDNCDSEPAVTMTDEIQNFPGGIMIQRCWVGTDDCDNASPKVCQNITILQGIPPGIANAESSGIGFSVSTLPHYADDELFSSTLHPKNASWADPGLISTIAQDPAQTWISTPFFFLNLNVEVFLNPGISLVFEGGRSKNNFLLEFQSVDGRVQYKGDLHENSYRAGVRLLPKADRRFYINIIPQYTYFNATRLRLHGQHFTLESEERMTASRLSLTADAGVRIPFFDAGSLDIEASFDTPRYLPITIIHRRS